MKLRRCGSCGQKVQVKKNRGLYAHKSAGVPCSGSGTGRKDHMREADEYFSEYIRVRDGHCIAQGWKFPCSGSLQCAHIITRSYKAIRTDPGNAVALCASHHRYVDLHPLEKADFFEERFPGLQERLKKVALEYGKVDWAEQAAKYQRLWEELV